MLSSKSLSEFISKDSVVRDYYRGVFVNLETVETMLNLNSKNCIIMAFGMHFIGLFIDQNNKGQSAIIDPAAADLIQYNEDLPNFMEQFAPKYQQLPFRVQTTEGELCGLYLCYFFHELCLNRSMSSAMKLFKEGDLRENDAKLIKWVKSTFPRSVVHNLFARVK